MSILDAKVERYVEEMVPLNNSLLEDIYQEGLREKIPIIQKSSLKLIETVINIVKPKLIIEVGTAIGFSAISFATFCPKTIIHTIERNPEMAFKAKNNILRSGFTERIILHDCEATEIISSLPKADLIFVDAAKGKYKDFFDLSFPLLNVGGVFVFDNILFRGYIADEEVAYTKPMLRKIRSFNEFLKENKKLITSFIPIGDGLAISYKLEE